MKNFRRWVVRTFDVNWQEFWWLGGVTICMIIWLIVYIVTGM